MMLVLTENLRKLFHSDSERLWVLRNAFRPDAAYKYPAKEEYGKKRSFQHAWIGQFPWLCYSIEENGGYCVHCVLFAKRHFNLGQLVTSPMTNFTRAKVTLSQASHRMASEDANDFINRVDRGGPGVSQLIQNEASARNRLKLKSIIKTIVFRGNQMIALRGHREQAEHVEQGANPGNFCALLDFRVDAGDVVLAERFASAPRNAQYNSPQIQNDLIACVGEWLRNKIISRVKTANFFSVIADEAVDCSNKEQLPLVVRLC